MTAPATPAACEATAATLPRSATREATCAAVAAALSTTAPAVKPPSTASDTDKDLAGVSVEQLILERDAPDAGKEAPCDSRARTHSRRSSALAKVFQSSIDNCCRKSAWWA